MGNWIRTQKSIGPHDGWSRSHWHWQPVEKGGPRNSAPSRTGSPENYVVDSFDGERWKNSCSDWFVETSFWGVHEVARDPPNGQYFMLALGQHGKVKQGLTIKNWLRLEIEMIKYERVLSH